MALGLSQLINWGVSILSSRRVRLCEAKDELLAVIVAMMGRVLAVCKSRCWARG